MSMEELKAQRAALIEKANAITDAALGEKRSLTDDEKRDHDDFVNEAKGLREVIETRAASDAELVRELPNLAPALDGTPAPTADDERRSIPAQPARGENRPVYGERSEHSYFVDVWNSRMTGNEDARTRIRQSDAFTATELQTRDLANVTNKGAESIVPLYLQDRFEAARVAKAITSGLTSQVALPPQGGSLTIPFQTGSAAVASLTQADPLNTMLETNAAFDKATENVVEVGGTQDISNYIIDRGTLGVGIDIVIANHLSDVLAYDENQRVLAKVLASAGKAVTYTATTGTLVGIYKKIADVVQQIHLDNLQPPTAIVVNPRRFASWASELDSSNRPLMVPMAVGMNPLATTNGDGHPVAQGFTGYSIHGLPIYVDATVAITGGAGTNEDAVFVADWKQQYTWLGPIMVDIDPSPMFKQSGKTVRARRYMATMVGHRTGAFGKITGTGLATPTF